MKVENGVIQSHEVKLPDEYIFEGGFLLVHVSEAMVLAREEGEDNNGGGSCLPQEMVDDKMKCNKETIEDGRKKGDKDVQFARKRHEFATVGERFEISNRSLRKEKGGPAVFNQPVNASCFEGSLVPFEGEDVGVLFTIPISQGSSDLVEEVRKDYHACLCTYEPTVHAWLVLCVLVTAQRSMVPYRMAEGDCCPFPLIVHPTGNHSLNKGSADKVVMRLPRQGYGHPLFSFCADFPEKGCAPLACRKYPFMDMSNHDHSVHPKIFKEWVLHNVHGLSMHKDLCTYPKVWDAVSILLKGHRIWKSPLLDILKHGSLFHVYLLKKALSFSDDLWLILRNGRLSNGACVLPCSQCLHQAVFMPTASFRPKVLALRSMGLSLKPTVHALMQSKPCFLTILSHGKVCHFWNV